MGIGATTDVGVPMPSFIQTLLHTHNISEETLLRSSDVHKLLEPTGIPHQSKQIIAQYVRDRSTVMTNSERARKVSSGLEQVTHEARVLVHNGKSITEGIRRLESSQHQAVLQIDALNKDIDKHAQHQAHQRNQILVQHDENVLMEDHNVCSN